ncbi:MAG: copper amine oxidase N-terminal domain-containing protein, partial [Clostridia bacterium]
MKKLLCVFLAVMMLASSLCLSVSASDVTVTLNGEELKLGNEIIVRDDSVFVPVRAVCEALGYEVSWNSEEKIVGLTGGASSAELTIDKKEVKKDGMTVSIDEAPFITYINDEWRTYMPL